MRRHEDEHVRRASSLLEPERPHVHVTMVQLLQRLSERLKDDLLALARLIAVGALNALHLGFEVGCPLFAEERFHV